MNFLLLTFKCIHVVSEIIDLITKGREVIEDRIPDIPYNKLEFVSKTEIGEGSFSKVFHCRWNNTDVALKKLKCRPGKKVTKFLRRNL